MEGVGIGSAEGPQSACQRHHVVGGEGLRHQAGDAIEVHPRGASLHSLSLGGQLEQHDASILLVFPPPDPSLAHQPVDDPGSGRAGDEGPLGQLRHTQRLPAGADVEEHVVLVQTDTTDTPQLVVEQLRKPPVRHEQGVPGCHGVWLDSAHRPYSHTAAR